MWQEKRNRNLKELNLPQLQRCGDNFLWNNNKIQELTKARQESFDATGAETQEYIEKYGKLIISEDPDDFLGDLIDV